MSDTRNLIPESKQLYRPTITNGQWFAVCHNTVNSYNDKLYLVLPDADPEMIWQCLWWTQVMTVLGNLVEIFPHAGDTGLAVWDNQTNLWLAAWIPS